MKNFKEKAPNLVTCLYGSLAGNGSEDSIKIHEIVEKYIPAGTFPPEVARLNIVNKIETSSQDFLNQMINQNHKLKNHALFNLKMREYCYITVAEKNIAIKIDLPKLMPVVDDFILSHKIYYDLFYSEIDGILNQSLVT